MKKFSKFATFALVACLMFAVVSGGGISAGVQDGGNTASDKVASAAVQTVDGVGGTQSEDMAAYLFVHFTGAEGSADDEQIYFSVSENGTDWKTLNGGTPVLRSTVGERGVRDPHIIRSPEGDKFYMIATDLSIYNINGNWGASQSNGSKSIVVWESSDLVHWSAPALRKISRDNATCTWAPESVYDDEREAYMVFWSSLTSKDDWVHRVYRCYTTDFETFTEPELYMENDEKIIDTTFIKEGDTYYRFTKNEAHTYIFMERGDSLDGDFELVGTFTINGEPGMNLTGFEGPTAYKINGENKWCLLLDNYGDGGYRPFVTDDISTGHFVSGGNFTFDIEMRHGTVIPITKTEYDALVAAYPVEGAAETGELVFSLDFEDSTTPSLGSVTVNGTLNEYGAGINGTKALKLTSGNYLTITEGKGNKNPLAGLESFTVSFAVKPDNNDSAWWFYASPNNDEQSYSWEHYVGLHTKEGNANCERYLGTGNGRAAGTSGSIDSFDSSGFTHITLVHRADSMTIYVNGAQKNKVSSSVSLTELLGSTPVIYIGRANWQKSGEFANGYIDAYKIYNYALSSAQVEALYKSDTGIAA